MELPTIPDDRENRAPPDNPHNTPVAVQQKMMRHADIGTTFNIYGDVVTDEMTTASSKVAQLAFPTDGAQTECKEG